ncbi:bifunctional [glutamate--ammonia ligase]-adenylyl-L-tyrosine phosphorylase/[glutamate--ammonia-ligase] adenylyltransferase [Qipengyuania sp. JC766]|uniref:bifunctional [glutamate--ammonia ligase]-adenylyl-L-tyrosine phosphorylase/[glutamate--ammonia-ligase] adenylyltransferase n=1 Tax=Qipengyuania sp. JC766 TaxID=3232139 RepID=UPI0034581DC6
METNWADAVARARRNSPFLSRALDRQPELAGLLEAGDGDAALAWAGQAGHGIDDVGVSLRRERLALATALAIGDLAGAFSLADVTGRLSDFADRALERAIGAAIARRVPDADTGVGITGFIALALGKHGACELNYSSDIDPILLYDPETLPRAKRDEPGEAAQRYARDVVRILSENTEEGYIFRVDLRLRPASEVSPLAISLNGAISHYESSALPWERAAFIRARVAAGDRAAGEEFLDTIESFVWRRSLDFGAIEEIGRLTERIRTDHSGPRTVGPGFDVKKGRGGIREAEFYAQTHQLIHGGRNEALRLRGTRQTLDALAAADIIGADDARDVGEAYEGLRTIEHRIQMLDDRQTHSIPDKDRLDALASLSGYDTPASLLAEVERLTAAVGKRFDRLLDAAASDSEGLKVDEKLVDRLRTAGFDKADELAERIERWHGGGVRSLRSEAAQTAHAALLPDLIEAFGQAPDPRRALLRWGELLETAPSAINLLKLLEARPALLGQLVGIITLAPPLAAQLGRRPVLFDALIDRSALDLPGDVESLERKMATDGDYEDQLDRLRIVTNETRFALGVQLVEQAHDPLEIAEALARLAEAGLRVAARAAEREFARKHGRIGGAELLIVGLGRLGGRALTHASDLDIVFLFTGDFARESDGDRPLGATLYFNRLAQRIVAALSVPTAEGALYEVDTRLRPQGAQGPLAVSVESFERYQLERAWTWEHMALTRARVLTGSDTARRDVEQVIEGVLCRSRDAGELRDAVLAMRSEMAQHKAARGKLDAKLLRGGLVDIEFLTHFLQLREETAQRPELEKAIARLVEQGLVGRGVADAHALMTRLLVSARLIAPDLSMPRASAARVLANLCGQPDPLTLLEALDRARRDVAEAWQEIFGEPLEIET